MKKKIFTLLTLAVMAVTGAWADPNTTLISGVSLPSTPTGTYVGGTSVSHNGTNTAVVVDGDGNAVMQASAPGYGTPTAANFTWTNAANEGTDNSWSTTGTTWDATIGSLFVGSTAFTTSGNAHYVNFARRGNLRTNRTFAYRFTNCEGVSALVKSNGNTDSGAAIMAVYKVNGENLIAVGSASSITKAVDIITVSDLNASDTYVAFIYGANSSNGELYEIAFLAPAGEPTIKAADATITATSSGVEATQNIAVTGKNLSGSTLTATLSPAVDGLSVTLGSSTITDGAISTTATLHYTQTVNASGATTLTLSDGTTSKDITVTYTASVGGVWTLQSVNTAKTWDFSKLTENTESERYNSDDKAIKLSDSTTPAITEEIIYANYDGTDFTIGSGFDGTSIAFTGQYPIRRTSFCQNGTIRFNTTVPGTITVKFSDTGSSASGTAVKRYLIVNGTTTEYWASRENNNSDPEVAYAAQLNVTTGDINVPAGDVTITGSSAIIVYIVTFTPATATNVTLNANGYATYSTYYDVEVSGGKAYTADLDLAGEKITLTEITSNKIPAGSGVLLYGGAGDEVTLTPTTGAESLVGNDLKATTLTTGFTREKGTNDYYALSGDTFMPFTGSAFAPNKAYFETDGSTVLSRKLNIIFDDATGIGNVVKNTEINNNEVYNLSGQRIVKPVKGLYIQNGRKALVK